MDPSRYQWNNTAFQVIAQNLRTQQLQVEIQIMSTPTGPVREALTITNMHLMETMSALLDADKAFGKR